MSFTTEIKNELCCIVLKKKCCRRAFTDGLMTRVNESDNRMTVNIGASNNEICEAVNAALGERFGGCVSVENAIRRGSQSNIFVIGTRAYDTHQNAFSCPNCAIAFLRGVFLSCGTVNDPEKASYHAEFVVGSAEKAGRIFNELVALDCPPKILNRKSGTSLYYKGSDSIEALLVTLGARNSAFKLMNCRIERTIRNEENRATNCVAQNIAKTVEASRKQVADIEALIASGRFDALPHDIRITARLRIDNPDASLNELAMLHKPPISKSGLNHRLAKIADEAKKISDN